MSKWRYIIPLSIWELLTRAADLVGLFLSMTLSELLVDNIVFGGAVYLSGEVWVIYTRLYNKENMHLLPGGIRSKGIFVFILAALLTVALLFVYPYIMAKRTVVALVLCIIGFVIQQMVTDTAAKRMTGGGRRRVLVLAGLHLLFLGMYGLVYAVSRPGLSPETFRETGMVLGAAAVTSLCFFLCQLWDNPLPQIKDSGGGVVNGDELMQVHAYRIYNRMTINTMFGFNVSILGFICYMRFLPINGFVADMFNLCVWLMFIALVTEIFSWLLMRRFLKRYDRHVIFAMGVLCWAIGTYGTIRGGWDQGLLGNLLSVALFGMGLASMLSIILVQSYEMKTVIELGVGKVDDGAYARNTSAMVDWTMLTSYLLMLVMLTLGAFIMDGQIDRVEAALGLQAGMQWIMLALPMGAVLVAVVYALLQPLDRNYAQKLRKYAMQQQAGQENPQMEKRLKKILVSNYPKRLALIILKPLLRPFFPSRVQGKERVNLSEGPVVFVCNHLEVYGPICAVLHSPFYFRPWVIQDMLDHELVYENMKSGIDKVIGFLPEKARRWLGMKVVPLVVWIMQATDPIPVYRGTVRGVIQTIQNSAEALTYDDNILLFPETDYPLQGVGEFFTGFVQVATLYHKQTGNDVTFYPMYIDKKKRTMTYGEGIRYDHEAGNNEERERIVAYLRSSMNEMAGWEEAQNAAVD